MSEYLDETERTLFRAIRYQWSKQAKEEAAALIAYARMLEAKVLPGGPKDTQGSE